MERLILHSDCNCFKPRSCLHHPEVCNKPVAVGVDSEPKHRHGIILAKNQIAKKFGVKTGEALLQANTRMPC